MRVATVLSALVAVIALVFGWREHARAADLSEKLQAALAAQSKAQTQASECKQSAFSSLGRAFSAFKKRPAPRPAAPVEENHQEKRLEDMSGEDQIKLFDGVDKMKDGAGQELAQMKSKLRMTAQEERKLDAEIEGMNQRIGKAIDRLVALASQKGKTQPRWTIDAFAEGLNAIRDADDNFRAALDDNQKKLLDDERFDLAKQVDPSMVLLKVMSLAAAMPAEDK